MEDLITECGGFGKYQFFLTMSIYSHKIATGWSMLQMTYAGFIPAWYCVLGDQMDNSSYYTNDTLRQCFINNNYTGHRDEDCQSHYFDGHARTIITEWDLVCERKWIKATVTSIQMAGVLVGAFVAGQLAAIFGRRRVLYGYALFHSLMNFGAAFSTAWEVFAAFRFFIGFGVGGILVVAFLYPMEFLPIKWRTILGVLPMWSIGVCMLALLAYLLDDWAYLHIALGVIGLFLATGYFFVPESVRWLALRGRYEEAEKIFESMAKMNSKIPPKQTRAVLEQIYKEDQEISAKAKEYTYRDLFKGRKQILISLIYCYSWFMMSCVFYGISFGVSALSGNLYLNIFLLNTVPIPLITATFYLTNRFGRKLTCVALLILGVIPSSGCLIVYFVVPSDSRGMWITVLSMSATMGVGPAWGVIMTWCTETFPTVIRSLGYGMVNAAARVGGIAAPFLIDLDNAPFRSYAIITSMLIVGIILLIFVPDTNGKLLPDRIDTITSLSTKKASDIEMETINGKNKSSVDAITKKGHPNNKLNVSTIYGDDSNKSRPNDEGEDVDDDHSNPVTVYRL